MSAPIEGETGPAPHSQDRPLQGGVFSDVNNEKNTQQVSGDHPTPEDGEHPHPDGTNEKQDGPPPRRSTFKNKFKEQKEKIKTKTKPPGGFDPTPIPDAPPGFTVKFIFHRAENLPAADISTGTSDPFLTATLTTSLPKRHKEDPDLVYRTRTIRKTLEPQWEQEWVVANVPRSGFKLKCRLYDEDWPDHNDRLGNVTIVVPRLDENWEGFEPPGKEFEVKKRSGSKRAYILKACTTAFTRDVSMTPRLYVSAVVLGKSDPPHGQMYTVGPTYYFRHFSPMIGRMTGIKVNRDEAEDSNDHDADATASTSHSNGKQAERRTQKYDFQANEIQLAGPVPPKLYHRYVEFRPIIGLLFRGSGLRGKILNKALHHQHNRVYNFDRSTNWGTFKPCSEEASLQFLKMAHFDEGGRIFTYVITLDGLMRFTETGKEFGIDLLSKHTMHSDASIYIACSGEFFIRRLKKPKTSEDPEPGEPTHPEEILQGGPPKEPPPTKPEYYQLIIDNDSGTYRPDKSVLPDLQKFLERNFPGLGIVALGCDDPEDQNLKKAQLRVKKREGRTINMVLNRSPSASSFSSDDISDLEDMERAGERGRKSKKERAWDLLEEPRRLKELAGKHSTDAATSGPSGSGTATSQVDH
ncbi:C2 domain-containing protein [Hypoxylon sp. EC38]|nr:C2 domain-containing protein [Hypoxylon sp. EC38]